MTLTDFLSGIIQKIVAVLPLDPIQPFINNINFEFVGWLNWFVPVNTLLTILAAWTAAITVFYLWMAIARWLKLIQ